MSNTQRTSGGSVTKRLPALYEVVDVYGIAQPGAFTTASRAFEYAKRLWPDQEQDPERTGKGWDVQLVGADG